MPELAPPPSSNKHPSKKRPLYRPIFERNALKVTPDVQGEISYVYVVHLYKITDLRDL